MLTETKRGEASERAGTELEASRREIDRVLAAFLEAELVGAPDEVGDVLRHAVLGPGKRLRPLLFTAAYRTAGGRNPEVATLACSVELVHTYSLIHDDLPCMDDDTLRRGRPALHVRFGVGPAVLAGAALLPLAIRALWVGGERLGLLERAVRRLARTLTVAAGGAGMAGGQLRDLRAEGRRLSCAELEEIHRGKTAGLMAASAVMGGVTAAAPASLLRRLRTFGDRLGLAFQTVDDLLDTGEVRPGGPGGRREDVPPATATGPAVLGTEAARVRVQTLAREAREALRAVPDSGLLEGLLGLALDRTS
ncbi:MAG: polyprenyl synthetase family protein [Gemmatimonadota bacterium]